MRKLDKEYLCNNIEMSIDKAEHIAEKIIQEYNLDFEKADETEDAILAGNRRNIWIEMEMLTDYIKSIRTDYNSIREAVMV